MPLYTHMTLHSTQATPPPCIFSRAKPLYELWKKPFLPHHLLGSIYFLHICMAIIPYLQHVWEQHLFCSYGVLFDMAPRSCFRVPGIAHKSVRDWVDRGSCGSVCNPTFAEGIGNIGLVGVYVISAVCACVRVRELVSR